MVPAEAGSECVVPSYVLDTSWLLLSDGELGVVVGGEVVTDGELVLWVLMLALLTNESTCEG